MPQKSEILSTLKELKPIYEKEGLILLGLFGSYAKDTQTKFSDIDIAYKLDYDKFSLKYRDGFSKLLRIDGIKNELQALFKTPIDLVPDTNKSILNGLINV
ncbi:nucleotidyltransferase domain-containing protein [Sulfurimonas sp.]|uniref:nucleotidyltransferase family protein n=1 Tax=Sulfurimonas sp. TaxID=2022749 RepID=UPI0025D14D1A|nr:nucleotidyltransferase domain-containing protein [Sulfurimonas sp.]MDD5157791.1 nucleotidyltransferase domain-containing protein [Sulfurimonas sp.]